MADAFDPIRTALNDSQTLVSAVNTLLPDVNAVIAAVKAAPAGTIPQDVLDLATAADASVKTATDAVNTADQSAKSAIPVIPPAGS